MTAVVAAQLSSNPNEFTNIILDQEKDLLEWLGNGMRALWEFIVNIVNAVTAWLVHITPPSLTWTSHTFSTAYAFLRAHSHSIHIICWSIFFGPMIILLPCLLVLEIIILVLFNFNFITHGILPGSPGDKYESLKEYFMESRESLFASVESATAKFNKWTVDSPPLLVGRVIAGIFGFLVLIGIWNGW
ncbi:hypothetical protein BYT27DRAFT_7196484 [Phlegmacium glaucopus]|nr:hypothetical protein BYT27DRAFT_7196484 [Phlegmacium glaucopus]